MIAIFDWQHHGKPNRSDRGAAFDVDGDGQIEHETELTRKYIEAARGYLESRGHTVHVLDSGWYGTRHHQANMIALANVGPVAYCAAHMNAGGGSYAAVFHDTRSAGGHRLARAVGSLMGARFAEISRVVVQGTSAETWSRPFATLKGIWSGPANISGICFEPAFMDNPKHAGMLTDEGLTRIGETLGLAVVRWASGIAVDCETNHWG